MKTERGEKAIEEKFEASRGCWFMTIRERSNFHNIKM